MQPVKKRKKRNGKVFRYCLYIISARFCTLCTRMRNVQQNKTVKKVFVWIHRECPFHLLDSTLPTYCTPKAIYIFAFYYEFYAWVLLVVSLHFSLLDEFLNLLITPSFRRPSTGWQKHLIPQGKKSRNSWYLIIGGIKIVACTLSQSGFVHYDRNRINPIVQSLQV